MPLVLDSLGFVRGQWYYPAAELFKLVRVSRKPVVLHITWHDPSRPRTQEPYRRRRKTPARVDSRPIAVLGDLRSPHAAGVGRHGARRGRLRAGPLRPT